MRHPTFFSVLSLLAATSHAADYAVLVAGSNGYENYRHQSDICHAFQILMKGGYRRENIILMSYDDAAFDSGNPFYGQLYNYPSGSGEVGTDVRKGCDPDYKGGNVTAENFLAVLSGQENGGKVLHTGKGDNIFVNFVDHGGVGIIAFPDGGLLHATDLQNTLVKMRRQQKFSKLTFYLEACESGSMFQNFPKNLSIYVTTAANPSEPSWATYCPPADIVQGQEIGTCLGDLYSVNWMQNADVTDLVFENLQKQFQIVKNLTNRSHVQQYGDVHKIAKLPAAEFEGLGDTAHHHHHNHHHLASDVSSRDVTMHLAYYKYLRSGKKSDFYSFMLEAEQRSKADEVFAGILASYPPHPTSYVLDSSTLSCVKVVHDAVVASCGGYSDYSMKYSYIAADLCGYTKGDGVGVAAAVSGVCKNVVKRE